MSAKIIASVVDLLNIRKHSNADTLDIADVLGYQVVVPKDKYKSGDRVVYIPADATLTEDVGTQLGVIKYLKGDQRRVGKIRLRGEPSFGLVISIPEDQNWDLGYDCTEYFKVGKYQPPIRLDDGETARYDETIDPYFTKYTDIENGRLFTDILEEGEEVVVTEKIHGRNNRVGIIGELCVAGSHTLRKKLPGDEIGHMSEEQERLIRTNKDWFPLSIPSVKNLLVSERNFYQTAKILYGEVFGRGIQNLSYGIEKGKGLGYRLFDISIDGKYIDYDDMVKLCETFGVETVPLIYRGPYSMAKIKELADGKSTMPGADHIREGVVVRPVKERIHPKIGRVVLKFIGTEYALSKGAEDDTVDV